MACFASSRTALDECTSSLIQSFVPADLRSTAKAFIGARQERSFVLVTQPDDTLCLRCYPDQRLEDEWHPECSWGGCCTEIRENAPDGDVITHRKFQTKCWMCNKEFTSELSYKGAGTDQILVHSDTKILRREVNVANLSVFPEVTRIPNTAIARKLLSGREHAVLMYQCVWSGWLKPSGEADWHDSCVNKAALQNPRQPKGSDL